MTEQAAKNTAEGSGLADIKGIAAALKAADDPAPGASGSDLQIGFGSSAAAPLMFDEPSSPISLTPEASPASPVLAGASAAPSRERPKGLAVAAGVLGAAVLILGGVTLTQEGEAAEPVAATQPAAAAVTATPEPEKPASVADGMVGGVVGAAQVEPLDPEPEPEPESEPEAEPAAEVEPEPETAAEPEPAEKKGRRGGSARPKAPAADASSADPAPTAEPEPEPEPVDDATKFGVDCILNPTAPGCGGQKKKVVEEKKVEENLPEKLSNADVRTGFNSVKAKAKGCGVTHGIFPGSKVLIKVSIEGATGKVLSAEAMGEHAGTRGGQCVADHLKAATFKRFKKEVMGVTFPVRI